RHGLPGGSRAQGPGRAGRRPVRTAGGCALIDNVLYALGRVARIVVLLMPSGLLLLAALRGPEENALMVWLAVLCQLLVGGVALRSRQMWGQSMGPSIITLYVIALGWLWLGSTGSEDWYPHLAQAVLLVVPLVVFAQQMLVESGASALRRACRLAQ